MAGQDAEAWGEQRPLRGSTQDGYVRNGGSVRTPDGAFLPGQEVARVERDGCVTRRDTVLLPGRTIGTISGNSVVHDGILGRCEYGYVDANRQVWLNYGISGKRIIGEVRGTNPQKALAWYVAKFDDLTQEVDEFEREVRAEFDKSPFIGRVHSKLAYLDKARVLGDIDRLRNRLRSLLSDIESDMERNARTAQSLIWKAQLVAESGDWKNGRHRLDAIMDEWKQIGRLPRDSQENLWQQFQAARQSFFDRMRQFFAAKESQEQDNLRAKRDLIRYVERLSPSDFQEARTAVRQAQDDWKRIGHVPRDEVDAIWSDFRRACDAVFDAARAAPR